MEQNRTLEVLLKVRDLTDRDFARFQRTLERVESRGRRSFDGLSGSATRFSSGVLPRVGRSIASNLIEIPSRAFSSFVQQAERAALAVTAIGAAATGLSIKLAAETETGIQRLRSLTAFTGQSAGEIRDAVLEISRETGVGVDSLLSTLFDIGSGITGGAEAFKVLEDVAKTSVGAVVDSTEIIEGLTTALNAFKDESLEASEGLEILLAAQDRGKGTIADLSSALGVVASGAADAGLSFRQTSGLIALLSRETNSMSEAATRLRALITFVNKDFEQFNKIVGENPVELLARDTEEFFRRIERFQRAGGLRLDEIFPGRVEARLAASALIRDVEAIGQAVNIQAASIEDLFGQALGTTTVQFNRFRQTAGAVFQEFGTALLPAVSSGFEAVNRLIGQSEGTVSSFIDSVRGVSENLAQVFDNLPRLDVAKLFDLTNLAVLFDTFVDQSVRAVITATPVLASAFEELGAVAFGAFEATLRRGLGQQRTIAKIRADIQSDLKIAQDALAEVGDLRQIPAIRARIQELNVELESLFEGGNRPPREAVDARLRELARLGDGIKILEDNAKRFGRGFGAIIKDVEGLPKALELLNSLNLREDSTLSFSNDALINLSQVKERLGDLQSFAKVAFRDFSQQATSAFGEVAKARDLLLPDDDDLSVGFQRIGERFQRAVESIGNVDLFGEAKAAASRFPDVVAAAADQAAKEVEARFDRNAAAFGKLIDVEAISRRFQQLGQGLNPLADIVERQRRHVRSFVEVFDAAYTGAKDSIERDLTPKINIDPAKASFAELVEAYRVAAEKIEDIEVGSKRSGLGDFIENAEERAREAIESLGSNLSDAAIDRTADLFLDLGRAAIEGTETAGEAFKRFAAGLAQDVAELFSEIASAQLVGLAGKGIQSLIGGFFSGASGAAGAAAASPTREGGIVQAPQVQAFRSGGVLEDIQQRFGLSTLPKLQAFAAGGIASGPTIPLVGEGFNREAIVPLPDGKNIPVRLEGGGGMNLNFYISAIDSKSFEDRVVQERIMNSITAGVARRMGRNPAMTRGPRR